MRLRDLHFFQTFSLFFCFCLRTHTHLSLHTRTLTITFSKRHLHIHRLYSHIQFWEDYALGKPVDVKKTLVEFNSGVDYPMSLFTEKLMFDYPEAKIILYVL